MHERGSDRDEDFALVAQLADTKFVAQNLRTAMDVLSRVCGCDGIVSVCLKLGKSALCNLWFVIRPDEIWKLIICKSTGHYLIRKSSVPHPCCILPWSIIYANRYY